MPSAPTPTSRERILAAIRQNKPSLQPLPERIDWGAVPTNLITPFKTMLQAIGATVVEAADYETVRAHVRETFPDVANIAVTVPELTDLADFSLAVADPHDLELINLAILPGAWGVAENGAIWLTEQEMVHRALPFITQHLALVIHRERLVATMHQAYERIRVDKTGFGAFIAGPSKTADIEQSLVIGAHGARSLVVYLLG
ncbi:MAG: lactate utilization protein [Cytophagaceae bacterium]|nr:lactate utilization protein [Cytophagaceae bacterium]